MAFLLMKIGLAFWDSEPQKRRRPLFGKARRKLEEAKKREEIKKLAAPRRQGGGAECQ